MLTSKARRARLRILETILTKGEKSRVCEGCRGAVSLAADTKLRQGVSKLQGQIQQADFEDEIEDEQIL